MSQSERPRVTVGCPACSESVRAAVPGGPGIRKSGHHLEADDEEHRLSGTETTCHNCGHTVELYYY
ncbi:hypothetical protein [Natronosalvus caseinilyticus]|uniref:hypothetical protein n=1 Tax=Natronosalvus caseinilyticus TaxID=2953747 RepID=UPI0028AE1B85|nr:hypothetical protein [Natronosalvus caseinilyticus]